MEQKIYGVIYKITNLINGMFYIGQTIQNPGQRWKRHVWDSKPGKSNNYLHHAIYLYGVENFIFEVIDTAPDAESLNLLEIYYIGALRCTDTTIGYNISEGGEGRGHYLHTEKTKQKMSLSSKGKSKSTEHRLNVSLAKNKNPPIMQFDLSGKFITKFRSAVSAEVTTGIPNSNISKACKEKLKQAGGYLWCYEGGENKLILPSSLRYERPIKKLCPITREVITTHSSIKAAGHANAISASSLSQAARGKRKTAGGFIWRYATASDGSKEPT